MKKHWQDWGNLILGLWVFVSPWALQHVMAAGTAPAGAVTTVAMWNLYIVGIAIAALAAAALLSFQIWEEWVDLILGVWLLVSPWVLGFNTSALLTWNAVIVGTVVVLLSGWAAASEQGPVQHA